MSNPRFRHANRTLIPHFAPELGPEWTYCKAWILESELLENSSTLKRILLENKTTWISEQLLGLLNSCGQLNKLEMALGGPLFAGDHLRTGVAYEMDRDPAGKTNLKFIFYL